MFALIAPVDKEVILFHKLATTLARSTGKQSNKSGAQVVG